MLSKNLINYIEQFPLVRLEFVIQFQAATELPQFSGSMIHGFLGHALKSVNERAFQAFYMQPSNSSQQPRPYSIMPDLREKTHWESGEIYRFEVTLFGEAHHVLQTIVDAVSTWQVKGLGEQRTPFKLIAVNQRLGNRRTSSMKIHSLSAHLEPLYFTQPWLDDQRLATITLTTPMRLKQHQQIQTEMPNAADFVGHIMRRFSLLFQHWVADDPRAIQEVFSNTPPPEVLNTIAHTHRVKWDRFSKKMHKPIPLVGFKGHVTFEGPVGDYVSWLAIGEQLQIGGKTTFGYGSYTMSV